MYIVQLNVKTYTLTLSRLMVVGLMTSYGFKLHVRIKYRVSSSRVTAHSTKGRGRFFI